MLGVTLITLLSAAALAQAGPPQHFGYWTYSPQVDRISDLDRSIVYAVATMHPPYAKGAMVVRCDVLSASGVSVYFDADRYLGYEDYYLVTYRVDKDRPNTNPWGASVDGEAVFLPEGSVRRVLNALAAGEELVVRIAAFDGDVDYVLPIQGLKGALEAQGCYTGALTTD